MSLEQPSLPHDRLVLGPLLFTCPSCQGVMEVSGLGCIVRSMDLYCSTVGCGRLARIKNPAFQNTPGLPGTKSP